MNPDQTGLIWVHGICNIGHLRAEADFEKMAKVVSSRKRVKTV